MLYPFTRPKPPPARRGGLLQVSTFFISLPPTKEGSSPLGFFNFISLPCARGGGFCAAKLGGIVIYLKILQNDSRTIPQSALPTAPFTQGSLFIEVSATAPYGAITWNPFHACASRNHITRIFPSCNKI